MRTEALRKKTKHVVLLFSPAVNIMSKSESGKNIGFELGDVNPTNKLGFNHQQWGSKGI
jgi:hypothetical protein